MEAAIGGLGVDDESQVDACEVDEAVGRVGLTDGDKQAACDIVDAVSVFDPGLGQFGVFEEARLVAQVEQVLE
jgi:hypothetical protein